MDPSDLPNLANRVKEEPSDASPSEQNSEMIDEKPDLKNFQLLSFAPEQSTHRKCEANRGSELTEKVEIVVECVDVKPNFHSLAVNKTGNHSPNRLRNIRDGDYYITQNMIKMEPPVEVKHELVCADVEESNLNFDCEPVEQNKERSTKTLNNKHNHKTHSGAASYDRKSCNCEICGKKFSRRSNMNLHVKSLHQCISYSCNICGKSFNRKGNLKTHIDMVHNGLKFTCDICGKKFSSKDYLRVHIVSGHNNTAYSRDRCQKTFTQKSHLKDHISTTHRGIKSTCDLCGKTFSQKGSLKMHIESVHNGIKSTCDLCGKTFSQKGNLKIHIESVHNGITSTCDLCGKIFLQKGSLKMHIESVHNKFLKENEAHS